MCVCVCRNSWALFFTLEYVMMYVVLTILHTLAANIQYGRVDTNADTGQLQDASDSLLPLLCLLRNNCVISGSHAQVTLSYYADHLKVKVNC